MDTNTNTNVNEAEEKKPSFLAALIIILFFAGCFIYEIIAWGSPDVHMTLIYASVFATIVLLTQGVKASKIEEGVIHGCKVATVSMMILMFVGIMIPAWTGAGTIPALIYYGLKIISPKIFLACCVFICAMSCLVTGTSWGTVATFGIAMMGIGHGLGVPTAWTAGAVISGALFGDTLSPVSDFANLASGACEVDLFKHVKSMFPVTVPSFIICLIAGLVMSIKFSTNTYDPSAVTATMEGIKASFNIEPLHAIVALIPMVIVLVLGFKKVSAMIAIVASSIAAMIIAIALQGYSFAEMTNFMNYGFSIETGNEALNALFNRSGLQSMMWTLGIGYLGLSYGGILEKTGVMDALLTALDRFTKNVRSLVITQAITGCIVAMISASDYVSILVSGRMFGKAYDKLGVSRTVESRTTVTCGAVFGWLFPWTVGGVYMSGVLGVSTFEFGKYAFYIFLILILTIIYALVGVFMPKQDQEEIDYREAKQKI